MCLQYELTTSLDFLLKRFLDFDIGFYVDREKLANYMSTQTEFHSLLETSFGYTGVNIKIPIQNDVSDMKIKKIFYRNEKWYL